ncbi:hypothetical protein E2C01_096354 [Portunus trituberculatus]|uniref:Uncharacterized protein n=1 Tax=Portunus trituberculatus TaxID=210409 RepID=A0A5B7JVE2_PORTR|nr:hypothetical protein [Portunus trituberculatus]
MKTTNKNLHKKKKPPEQTESLRRVHLGFWNDAPPIAHRSPGAHTPVLISLPAPMTDADHLDPPWRQPTTAMGPALT